MDAIDRKIIGLLAEDARRPLAGIGDAVGLSTSAVNDRVRRLVASGSIRRFTVDADPEKVGLPIRAFVWIAVSGLEREEAFRAYAAENPFITECHHVTGGWSYAVKVHAASLTDLERLLADLKASNLCDRSETVVALSTIVEAPFAPPFHDPG